ncbi:unnamed protein product [Staurois parvus]|uniref:Uncharacterized protein n=1 Tax=Staurois parvus TaxID=386267 RepID=A0ABN9C6Z8_9NEOB|nr:unnamed protein product [Staurois parvus]
MMSQVTSCFTTLHVITDWPTSAPFAASAVNHRVPDRDYSPAPGDCRASPTGGGDCI